MTISRQNLGFIGFWYVLTGSFVLVVHFLFLYALRNDNPVTIIEINWSRFLILFTFWPLPMVTSTAIFGIFLPIYIAKNYPSAVSNYFTSKFFLYALGLLLAPVIAAIIIYSIKKRLEAQRSPELVTKNMTV